MTEIAGSAVAITGAGQGIGRALAHAFVRRGADLALADRDAGALAAVAGELAGAGRRITTHVVDVAEQAQVQRFASEAIAAHRNLGIAVNNAGVALFGQFHELSLDDMSWLMGVNFWGVVHGTHAFLPHFRETGRGHIVNLSSIFGIIAPPGQTAYAAAKFAVRGFSEALRHELEMQKSPIRLSVVHPGGIKTGIARSSRVGAFMTDNKRRADMLDRFESFAATTPETAAERILQGITRDEPRILIGADARRMDLVQRLMPVGYWRIIARKIEATAAKAAAARDRG